jgi:integrase/recombinase XerD
VTRLRKTMLDELRRRNYAQSTVRTYVKAIEDFARYFGKSPERLGPQHIRQYQVHLFHDRKLAATTVVQRAAALRFLFVKTLHRPYLPDQIPFPKRARRLPTVLSLEEVALLIDCAKNLMHRAILMTLYATGLRRAELCRLKVADIDSERMVIHVHEGKGGRDRDVLLSPKLLETLREYWRWLKPKTWLFPGMIHNWRSDVPMTEKVVWEAVRAAKERAGITKHVSPHTLRHASAYYTTFQSLFILKAIALGQAQSTAVYGRCVRLVLVPAPLASLDRCDRLPTAHTVRLALPGESVPG